MSHYHMEYSVRLSPLFNILLHHSVAGEADLDVGIETNIFLLTSPLNANAKGIRPGLLKHNTRAIQWPVATVFWSATTVLPFFAMEGAFRMIVGA